MVASIHSVTVAPRGSTPVSLRAWEQLATNQSRQSTQLPYVSPLKNGWMNNSTSLQELYTSSQYAFFSGRYWTNPVTSASNSMSSSFVAVANTLGGIQSSDDIAVLPLNLAYGTATSCTGVTCYVWVQFAIDFQPGGSTAFLYEVNTCCDSNGNIIYGTGGLLGNGNEWSTAWIWPWNIGVSYQVGDSYHVSVFPYSSTQIEFALTDDTKSTSWYQLSNVPSTNVLPMSQAFSPAVTIEGHLSTSVTSLTGFPYMDIDVTNYMQNSFTLSGTQTIGANPVRCDGSNCPISNPTGAYDYLSETFPAYWRWAVSSSSSMPIPNIHTASITITPSSSIILGETATIDIPISNDGASAAWMTAQISFPSNPSLNSIYVISTGDTWSQYQPQKYATGTIFPAEYAFRIASSSSTVPSSYVLVEGSSSWPSGTTKHLRVSVTPSSSGDFWFQVKSVASYSGGNAVAWAPQFTSSPTGAQQCSDLYNICRDQQSEFIYKFKITVTSPYSVTFAENNIPSGTSWGVTVNGQHYSTSSGTSIPVSGLTGTQTYSYDSPVSGSGGIYTCTSTNCSGSVSGSGTVTPTYTFTSNTYSVTFDQSGIPTSGVTWGVTVGGTDHTGSGSSITVSGLTGTQTYSYDSPVSGSGGIYTCTSKCSGSVSISTGMITATYEFSSGSVFGFSLSNSGGITVTQGSSGQNTITATLTGGSTQSVSLSCTSVLPSGASCSFNPSSGNPTFSSTLTISTSSSTPTGSVTVTVTGSGGGQTPITQFTLTVNTVPPPATCTSPVTIDGVQWSYTKVSGGGFNGYPKCGTGVSLGYTAFYLDTPGNAEGYFQDQFPVPTASPTFTAWIWGAYDPVTVTITVITSSGSTQLGSFTPNQVQQGQAQDSPRSYSLSSWAGETVTIRIDQKSSGNTGTIAYYKNLLVAATPIVTFNTISSVVSAGAGSVWFVLPDFTAGESGTMHTSAAKCGGNVAALATDVYSATYLFGALTNPQQNEVLDTNSAYVSQSGGSCGQPTTPTSQPLVAISGPVVSEVVDYYESKEATSPLYFYYNNGQECFARRDTGATVACFNPTATNDVFLMEAFTDASGRTVYIIYGLQWGGTLAGFEYVVNFVLKNPSNYADSWYVYRWQDATSGPSDNGIPDAGDTYTQIAVGNVPVSVPSSSTTATVTSPGAITTAFAPHFPSIASSSDPSVSVGSISSYVSASGGTAWVVMPDFTAGETGSMHTSGVKCDGNVAALDTDVYAGTYFFGSFTNAQNEVLDTNSAYVSQSTSSCGKPTTPASQPLVAISGPVVSEVVDYYESSGVTPLYFYYNSAAQSCFARRDTGASVVCFKSTATKDVFLMEAFTDSAGRPVYIIYGLQWGGTLAGFQYLVNFVLKNPSSYTSSWYVYQWTDAPSGVSANSIPDPGDTYTQIATG